MTEIYSHKFQSGRVITAVVKYRRGRIPDLRCKLPGILTPEEDAEHLIWRKAVAGSILAKLDPVAVTKLKLQPDEETELPSINRTSP